MIRELSLFSGIGGGLLASRLLGHRIIGYVERDEYCQRVISQRIIDGILDAAPIFGNITTFIDNGYAESYKNLVDVISGGFPCQDISHASKSVAGIHGSRSALWFTMAEAIRIIRPRYVYVENVSAVLVRGLDTILCSLAQMGYNASWGIVSAADLNAPHVRTRMWLLAVADTNGERSDTTEDVNVCTQKVNAKTIRQNPWSESTTRRGRSRLRRVPEREFLRMDQWTSAELDIARAIGNAQVPVVAAIAWRILSTIHESMNEMVAR